MPKLLVDWLRVEPTGTAFWKFLGLSVIVIFGFATWVEIILNIASLTPKDSKVLEDLLLNHTILIFSLLPLMAAIEELIFRLPLRIFLKRNATPVTLCVVTLVLSFFFGYGHGGWIGVPIQGVVGIIFCVVFLKCGGFQKKYWKAFLSSTAVHFAYNYIAFGAYLLFFV